MHIYELNFMQENQDETFPALFRHTLGALQGVATPFWCLSSIDPYSVPIICLPSL